MKKWHWSALFYSVECLYLIVLIVGVVQLLHPGFAEPIHSPYFLLPDLSAAVVSILATPSGRSLQDPAFWGLICREQWLVLCLLYGVFVMFISPALSLVRRQRPRAVCLAPLYWLFIGSFIYVVPQPLTQDMGTPIMVFSVVLNATLLVFSGQRLRGSLRHGRSPISVLGCGANHSAQLADAMPMQAWRAVDDSESSVETDQTISLTREKVVQE
jgi:hypothetical protein